MRAHALRRPSEKHETSSDRRGRSAPRAPPESGTGHRHERLSRIFQEEIEALVRDELTDPRLDGVRVTTVELSPDYKSVRVRFLGPAVATASHDARERTGRALARATPFLRIRLAESV